MLKQEIKDKSIEFLKSGEGNKTTKLKTVLGEIQQAELSSNKELSDQEVINIIKKFIKNINDTIVHIKDEAKIKEFEEEIELYKVYLPEILEDHVIRHFFNGLDCEKVKKNMGQFMGALKQYAKETKKDYDGKQASEILKEILK